MKIEEFGTLQMKRTHPAHVGKSELSEIGGTSFAKKTADANASAKAEKSNANAKSSFSNYLLDAMQSMNNQQIDVTKLEKELIINPDSVDIEDVTIAMAKARMSLNLAQSVIDRIVSGWNEISTTR